MERKFSLCVCAMLCCSIIFGRVGARAQQSQPSQMQQSAEEVLTNASVVRLVRAGFRERTLIAIIRARPCRFDLAPDRLIELRRQGISERLILAMIARDDANVLESNDWNDDAFFGGRERGNAGQSNGSSRSATRDPDETNIFGSSGGSRERTQQRAGSGSGDGNTETTGSATVRILRPAEAGGAQASPRLERTPTLTNDSVVELVEAGFSEGTIIRRIEQSPVEFDLSPTKISELQHRRVSDRIIAAMRNAMSDDAPPRMNAAPTNSTPER